MQLDFHHAVTYVVARLGGLKHEAADVVAHCAQYVDDATNEGIIHFDNGALYGRISSAHRMLDYRNFLKLADSRVWVPFHFLPGNLGHAAGSEFPGSFIDRLITRPNSRVAQDMVRAAIVARGAPHALHRLGITMHVYCDTWAHQGFAGVIHPINEATDVVGADGKPDHRLLDRLRDQLTTALIDRTSPLGHGAVLSNPDRPYLVWSYTNGHGQRVVRDNPRDFLDAADHMCRAVQRFELGEPEASVPGLPDGDARLLDAMFREVKADETERHDEWLAAIASGRFSFGKAEVRYVPKGAGSWKHAALGTEASTDTGDEEYAFKPHFLHSHWKLFHDALQVHRLEVLTTILPRYGICAA